MRAILFLVVIIGVPWLISEAVQRRRERADLAEMMARQRELEALARALEPKPRLRLVKGGRR